MILNEFEKEFSSKWGEFKIWESAKQKKEFYSQPLPLAFAELDAVGIRVKGGKVIIDSEMEKHWDVIMKEYSISRLAAEVLMYAVRKFPSSVRIATGSGHSNLDCDIIKNGLDELTEAGVVDRKRVCAMDNYELSHDLLASVVLGRNFAEMWADTQKLRSTRKLLDNFDPNSFYPTDSDPYQF